MNEGTLLWTPRPAWAETTHLARYMRWLADTGRPHFTQYDDLRVWSVNEPDAFWASLWDFFEIRSDRRFDHVVTGTMPNARWFTGSRVNYTEHQLRHAERMPETVAIHHRSEAREPGALTWSELAAAVRVLATYLRELGVQPGDRVVAYMPNIIEAAIAMMATAAIGAIWAAAAPEFGVSFVVDRFAQIAPRVVFVADGYRFAGKDFDRRAEISAIVAELPSIEHVIVLPYLDANATFGGFTPAMHAWSEIMARAPVAADAFAFERVAEDHPLWILFSSGTTGLPKAIAQTHIGILIETQKNAAFHANLGPGQTQFFYSTTGWMMWNALLNALLVGTTIVLYDGHPAHPSPDLLWTLAAETRATCFGASPTYVAIMRRLGLRPMDTHDLSALESIFLSGSPSTPETFAWFYESVKTDLWVTSQSGGTELCSGIVGAVPTLPVYAGEIQARLLGMDVHVWNARGEDVIDEVGELVITKPAPSMPLRFWNDPNGERYLASYFDTYPGVWRHGDFIKLNARGGCYVYGRSDATLNRYGVRIGSAEIYRALDELPQIAEALIVCLELPDGGFYMPLFVKTAATAGPIDDAFRQTVNAHLRIACSPRHVPDEIVEVPALPYTLSGKKMEIPVRRILAGDTQAWAASRESSSDPAALDWFVTFTENRAVR